MSKNEVGGGPPPYAQPGSSSGALSGSLSGQQFNAGAVPEKQPDFQPPSGPPPQAQQFQPPSGPPPQQFQSQPPRQPQPVLAPDDPMWCLQGYDIVYIVDDSSSMSWEERKSGIVPWPHARNALVTFSTMCSAWDLDGQDMYFLNVEEPVLRASPQVIEQVFNLRSPRGGTNMGRKLYQVASNYFRDFRPGITKPVNIIAITDGQFSDDVMSVLRWIIEQLDRFGAMPNQFGIQFVQIGADSDARKCLERLDDDLGRSGMHRDIVDTVPWSPQKMDGPNFDGNYLVKVVCGAVNKRLDKKSLKPVTKPKKKESRLKRFFS